MASGVSHSIISINSATPTIVTPTDEPSNLRANVSFQNLGTSTIYFGGSNVSSTSYGVAVSAGDTLSIDDLPNRFDVFAVSTEPTCNVAVMLVSYA